MGTADTVNIPLSDKYIPTDSGQLWMHISRALITCAALECKPKAKHSKNATCPVLQAVVRFLAQRCHSAVPGAHHCVAAKQTQHRAHHESHECPLSPEPMHATCPHLSPCYRQLLGSGSKMPPRCPRHSSPRGLLSAWGSMCTSPHR